MKGGLIQGVAPNRRSFPGSEIQALRAGPGSMDSASGPPNQPFVQNGPSKTRAEHNTHCPEKYQGQMHHGPLSRPGWGWGLLMRLRRPGLGGASERA